MTRKERDTVERAIVRAHDYDLQIVGHGFTKPDGFPCWAVTSRNSDSVLHIVALVGERLQCDCVAYKHGQYCCHRGLVHQHLVETRRRLARERKEQQPSIPATPVTEGEHALASMIH